MSAALSPSAVPKSLIAAGRFALSTIMQEAVTVARQLRAGGATWQWRMRIALRAVWRRARAERAGAGSNVVALVPAAAPIPRLVLNRSEAFAVLFRIQAHPINRGRNLVADTVRLSISELLDLARAEYRNIPLADRAAILAGIGEAQMPVPVVRRRAFVSGSRAHSHGW